MTSVLPVLSKTKSGAREVVVSVRDLTKKYKKTGQDALSGVNLEVERGDLFGLIGPDGAGKSTALKILAGILKQSGGEATVFGKKPADARKTIGFVPQNTALYPELSVEENLRYQAGLYGISDEEIEKLKKTHLESMGLLKFADRLASKLSGGMKQKLALCCALVSDPKLIILDEPTCGLDPFARRELWQVLNTLSHDGKTVIIATPFLDEAERCNRIALMYNGKIEQSGAPLELEEALHLRRLTFLIKDHEKLNSVPALIEKVELGSSVKDIYMKGDRLEVLIADSDDFEMNRRVQAGAAPASATTTASSPDASGSATPRHRFDSQEPSDPSEAILVSRDKLQNEIASGATQRQVPAEFANPTVGSELPQISDPLLKTRQADEPNSPSEPTTDEGSKITGSRVAIAESIKRKFGESGLTLSDAREMSPGMENVFVMRLRELGVKESELVPFPHLDGGSNGKGAAVSKEIPRDNARGLSDRKPESASPRTRAGAAVKCENLEKRFSNFTAVDGVSLEVHYGEILGLLGANGAGKTTTIKMLCGLATPSSGKVELQGEKKDLRSPHVRQGIGYMSQKFSLYDNLTVRENLAFYAGVYGIPLKLRQRQIDWVIEACDLKDFQKSIVGTLPLGWKQRIAFGAAVMHDPKIIFLDEPTSGVDPLARRQMWTLIREFADSGAAILVTTHYLDEAEFCSQLAFMSGGKIVTQGSPTEIKQQHERELFKVETDDLREAFQLLTEQLDHWRVAICGNEIHVLLDDGEGEVDRLRSILRDGNCEPREIKAIDLSLEDAFIDVVERSKRADV